MSSGRLLILAFIAPILFSTCKKGVDDPLVSLRSRKSRVEGSWRLLEGRLEIGSTNATNASHYNEIYDFKDGRYQVTTIGDSLAPPVSSGTYVLNLKFEQQGACTVSELLDSKKLSAKGTWDFNNGVGEEKKKEILMISLKEVISSATGGYHFFNQSSVDFTYKIKELRNKRMVLKADVPIYIDATGDKQTFYGEFTFVQ